MMFQADCDADYQDWTEAMSVLIQKIELKTGLKVQDLELDKDGKDVEITFPLGYIHY